MHIQETIIKKIFVASSMKHPMRNKIANYVNDVNLYNNNTKIHYKLSIFPKLENHELIGVSSTQDIINDDITTSDIIVLLVENGMTLGEISFEELMVAHNAKKPIICYVTKKHEESKSTTYCLKDGDKADIEDVMNSLGHRYVFFVSEEKDDNTVNIDDNQDGKCDITFKQHFTNYLRDSSLGLKRFRQEELSYEDYVRSHGQQYRTANNKYYSRYFDKEIESILYHEDGYSKKLKSSLLILEGQSYSGKTRSAFNLMTTNNEWKDHNFYCINGNEIDSLDRINSINTNTRLKTVVLIDDINEAIRKWDGTQTDGSFLNTLRNLTDVPKWNNLIVIITVSGKANATEINITYHKLFGEIHSNLLNGTRVNFNQGLTKQEFKKLVSELRQEGLITSPHIYPGNYTIGSLFINQQELQDKLSNAKKDGGNIMLHTIKAYRLYNNSTISYNFLNSLYNSIFDEQRLQNYKLYKSFDNHLDSLRKNGLIYIEYDQNNAISNIDVDDIVLENFDFVGNSDNNDKQTLRCYAISDLINFAKKHDIKTGDKSSDMDNIFSMGHKLLSYNTLVSIEISNLIVSVCTEFGLETNNASILNLKKKCATQQLQHLDRFCATAYANLIFKQWNSFEKFKPSLHIDDRFFKNTLIALLHEKFKLSKFQEQDVLNKIFPDNNCIFTEDDLKNIFTLKRLSPFLIKKGLCNTEKILEFAENATIDNGQSDSDNDSDSDNYYDPFAISTTNDDTFLLSQIGKVICELFQTINSFDNFNDLIVLIKGYTSDSTIYKATNSPIFSHALYYLIKDKIIKQVPFPDRYSLFSFVLASNPNNILESGCPNNSDDIFIKRIALNDILKYLDEANAIEAFNQMYSQDLTDRYTLPCLMNNRFLGFEQLFGLVQKLKGTQMVHFITLNQLLIKAETKTDAISCLKLMGIRDSDPRKLKDESALGTYIGKKYVTVTEAIALINSYRDSHPGVILRQETIGKIIGKNDFKPNELYNILFSDSNSNTQLKLTTDEINAVKRNRYCYNFLLKKINHAYKNNDGNNITLKASEIYTKITEQLTCNNLINELLYSEDTSSILSEYLKSDDVFPDYNSVNEFIENLPESVKFTEYIYSSLLYRINHSNIDNSEKIRLVNQHLITAYNDFAQRHCDEEVIKKMSKIYATRIELVNSDDFDKEIEYPFESELKKIKFVDYLNLLVTQEPGYANGTFIYNALKAMKKSYNNNIYSKLYEIVTKTRDGIFINTLNDTNIHKDIIDSLFRIENETLFFDKLMFVNFSPIKMLWWLLNNGKIDIIISEKYRKEHNLTITQTYLNILFKQLAKEAKTVNDKDNYWNNIKEYFNLINDNIYFSIQMAVAILEIANNFGDIYWVEAWDILNKHNFTASHPEIIDIQIKHLYPNDIKQPDNVFFRWKDITQILQNNKDIVNITNINSCLNFLNIVISSNNLQIIKNGYRSKDPKYNSHQTNAGNIRFDVWKRLSNDYSINIDELANSSLESMTSFNKNGRMIDADIRTFIYFTHKGSDCLNIIYNKFNSNFDYDNNKNCLEDFLKNLSRSINNQKNNFKKDDIKPLLIKILKEQDSTILRNLSDNYTNFDKFAYIQQIINEITSPTETI